MEGAIGHLEREVLAEPALDVEVAREARGRRQTRLELGEDRRRQRLLAGRCPGLFVGEEGLKASLPIPPEPGGHGIPVQSQVGSRLLPGGHLARFEQH
jgi:hypothetical protein